MSGVCSDEWSGRCTQLGMGTLIEQTPQLPDTGNDGWDVTFALVVGACLIGIVLYDLIIIRSRRFKRAL